MSSTCTSDFNHWLRIINGRSNPQCIVVAERFPFDSFSWDNPVNEIGSMSVQFLLNTDTLIGLPFGETGEIWIQNGFIFELWGQHDGEDCRHFVGIHRCGTDTRTDASGKVKVEGRFVFPDGHPVTREVEATNGVGLNDILALQPILYPENSPRALKDMDIATAIYEYVKENIGSDATSPPRLKSGVYECLTFDPDPPPIIGLNYKGDNSYETQNGATLWDTIADMTSWAMSQGYPLIVDVTTPIGGCCPIVKIRPPTDCRVGNAQGNAPYILSLKLGTAEQITFERCATEECRCLIAFGEDEDGNELMSIAESTGSAEINIRVCIEQTSIKTQDALDQFAAEQLAERLAQNTFAVTVPKSEYGRFCFDKDPHKLVTIDWHGAYYDAWITDISGSVSSNGESINIGVTLLDNIAPNYPQ